MQSLVFPPTSVSRCCILVSLYLCAAVLASGQQTPSNSPIISLRVVVTDEHQRPVRRASCSLSRSKDSIAVATAMTDEQGVVAFSGIPPDTYVLRVEGSGFAPFIKTDIVVANGPPSEIAVSLAVSSLQENVTITATADATTSVEAGASIPTGNLKREELRRLPLATSRIDDALPLTPGVVRTTTGEISIKGATEQQSALLVNGLNAGDPASGNFQLNLPVDSVEAIQVFQHPYTAEYGEFTGGLTSVETRRGGDHLHFEINDFLPDLRIRERHIRGIADDTPRLNLNGPLIANRLYFSQSLSYTFSRTPVRGLAFPFDETKAESLSSFTQVDLLVSNHHTQTFTFGYFPQRDQFVGLDFFRPQTVTPNYRQRNFIFTARDRYSLGDGLLESSFSIKRFNAAVWGQGTDEQTLTPTVEQGNYFATQNRHSERAEFLEVYTSPAVRFLRGSHEIKAGLDYNSSSNQTRFDARPVNILREDGTLTERIVFDGFHRIRGRNREYVGFLQDRWTALPNLSFDFGLRYENQRIAHESNLAPRFGFAWSPFGGDRTVLRGGIGFFYDRVPLNIRNFARYPARTITHYGADGLTVIDSERFVNVLVNTKPVEPLDYRRSNREAGFVPENLTWNIQLDQVVNPWLSLRANLTASRTDHIYIVNPELDYRGQRAIVLRSAGQAAYRALELTARLTLPEKNVLYLSYVRSRARGDLNDFNSYFGDFGSPLIRPNQYSNLPFDVPNRLIAWGTISLPRRISISPIFEVRDGFPYAVRDGEQNFVGVRNSDRTRFPTFLALDMEVAKEFQVTKKYGVRLSLRGFNVTNHFNPRDVRANTADPQFGQSFASYRRYFTGGFDIIF